MKRKWVIIIGSAVLVLLLAAAVFPYAWPASYLKLSYWHARGVTNPVPRVAVLNTTAAAQAGILPPTYLTFGDRVWGVVDVDSVVGAGGGLTWFESIPLDSVRWNATHDSLVSGVELGARSWFFWDDIDGL